MKVAKTTLKELREMARDEYCCDVHLIQFTADTKGLPDDTPATITIDGASVTYAAFPEDEKPETIH